MPKAVRSWKVSTLCPFEVEEVKQRLKRSILAPENEGACWEWKKSLCTAGYGQIRAFGQKWGAHRLAHLVFSGSLSPGLVVMHLCSNPLCVNPQHLKEGTYKENNTYEALDGPVGVPSPQACESVEISPGIVL